MFTVECTAERRGVLFYRTHRAATVPLAYAWLARLAPSLDKRGTVARFTITADHGQVIRRWQWERP